MTKKQKCEDCYVEIRKYTIIRGVFMFLIIQFLMMIPIFNVWALIDVSKSDRTKEYNYEGIFYDIKKLKVQKEDEN